MGIVDFYSECTAPWKKTKGFLFDFALHKKEDTCECMKLMPMLCGHGFWGIDFWRNSFHQCILVNTCLCPAKSYQYWVFFLNLNINFNWNILYTLYLDGCISDFILEDSVLIPFFLNFYFSERAKDQELLCKLNSEFKNTFENSQFLPRQWINYFLCTHLLKDLTRSVYLRKNPRFMNILGRRRQQHIKY